MPCAAGLESCRCKPVCNRPTAARSAPVGCAWAVRASILCVASKSSVCPKATVQRGRPSAALAMSDTVHLIVLQHGLWGRPSHLERLHRHLETAFKAKQADLGNRIEVLNSAVNIGKLTFDGVDTCGSRLVKLILKTVEQYQEQGQQVVKLSLIGYSLGGLIVRYAAGKLYVLGLFEEVEPTNVITIATPHLGSFREPTSLWAKFFNSQVALIASRTGLQLMLGDADYTVPWLTQQQERHEQAHQQYLQHKQQQPKQQQKQQHEVAGQPAAAPDQQQQQQHLGGSPGRTAAPVSVTGGAAGGKGDRYDPHGTSSVSAGGTSNQPTAEGLTGSGNSSRTGTSGSSSGENASNNHSSGGSSSRGFKRQSTMPPGVDPAGPVPLLLLMAHPSGPFSKALASFRTRICAANIKHDTTVPYCTAAMRMENPYESKLPVAIDPQYPSVVRPAAEGEDVELMRYAGKYRIYLMFAFIPLFPLYWAVSVANGYMHRRRVSKMPVDMAWLQQHAAQLNSLTRQPSRRQSFAGPAAAPVPTGLGSMRGIATKAAAAGDAKGQVQVSVAAAHANADNGASSSNSSSNSGRGSGSHGDSSSSSIKGLEAAGQAPGPHPVAAAGSAFMAAATVPIADVAGDGSAAEPLSSEEKEQQQQQQAQMQCSMPRGKTSISPGLAAAMSNYAQENELDTLQRKERQLTSQPSWQLSRQVSAAAGDAGGVSEHEGIVETPELLHQQQQWMAEQLFEAMPPCVLADGSNSSSSSSTGGSKQATSSGGWHRVDVATYHVHAHAAIIVRDRRFEQQSKDLFEYLAFQMSR